MNEHKRVRLLNPIYNKEKQALKRFGSIWFRCFNNPPGLAICVMTDDSLLQSALKGDIRWWPTADTEIIP